MFKGKVEDKISLGKPRNRPEDPLDNLSYTPLDGNG